MGIDARYEICDLPELKVLPEAEGYNVTMPYKRDVIPFCRSLTRRAALSNSVNTIVGGTGDTTDGAGLFRAIDRKDRAVSNMVILGDGGAARSILAAALEREEIRSVAVFSRERSRNYADLLFLMQNLDPAARERCHICSYVDAELKEELRTAEFLVNATCVGMACEDAGDGRPDCLVKPGFLRKELLVADAVYKPEETPLLKMARERGCETVTGREMLIGQAMISFEQFTGSKYPDEEELWNGL